MRSPKLSYERGDACWIFTGAVDAAGQPKLESGRVVHAFYHPGAPNQFYVIQLDDENFMHLEVRDALLMADSPDGVLPYSLGRSNV